MHYKRHRVHDEENDEEANTAVGKHCGRQYYTEYDVLLAKNLYHTFSY